MKCQIIRYFLAFASLCFSKKHIYTVDELHNCLHRLTIVFTFVLEIFVNDDDLDQTLSELPDVVDVHVVVVKMINEYGNEEKGEGQGVICDALSLFFLAGCIRQFNVRGR